MGEDDPVAIRMRQATLYNTHAKPNLNFDHKPVYGAFNRQHHDWILQNKFEYGYSPVGGRKLASLET